MAWSAKEFGNLRGECLSGPYNSYAGFRIPFTQAYALMSRNAEVREKFTENKLLVTREEIAFT